MRGPKTRNEYSIQGARETLDRIEKYGSRALATILYLRYGTCNIVHSGSILTHSLGMGQES